MTKVGVECKYNGYVGHWSVSLTLLTYEQFLYYQRILNIFLKSDVQIEGYAEMSIALTNTKQFSPKHFLYSSLLLHSKTELL